MNDIFRQICSLRQICYHPSELAADNTLSPLFDQARQLQIALFPIDPAQPLETQLMHSPICANDTLLLAGSLRTLESAADLPVAIIGYGELFSADLSASPRQPDILVESFEEVDLQFFDRIMKRAQHLPWVTLVTRRFLLREITLDDLDDLYELYSGEGITDYIEDLYDRPEEETYTRAYIENMYRFYGYGMWLVIDRQTGALIGRAGFSHQDLGDEVVLEMGYLIGKPYQRQGYATEICTGLIDFARANLGFDSISCFVDPGNQASIHLLENLHFQKQKACTTIGGHAMLRFIYFF